MLSAATSRVRIPAVSRYFIFKSPRPPEGITHPLFQYVPVPEVKQPAREVDRLLAYSDEVTYEWLHTSTSPVCLHGWDRGNFSTSKVYELLLLFASHVPTNCGCRGLLLHPITYMGTHTHTHTHTHTLGRVPLDEGSVCRRGLYLYNI